MIMTRFSAIETLVVVINHPSFEGLYHQTTSIVGLMVLVVKVLEEVDDDALEAAAEEDDEKAESKGEVVDVFC